MGKVSRWLWGLFGMKKQKEEITSENPVQSDVTSSSRERKRWSFSRMGIRDSGPSDQNQNQNIPASGRPGESSSWMRCYENKHAIAVAAATAAAADAAVAAAHAAVAVVRLTGQGRGNMGSGGRTDHGYGLAALKIQCNFRGYLGRKALRALKALVKLQALVRGYLVRKKGAATLHSMEALLRVQYSIQCQRVHRLRGKINNVRSSQSQSQSQTSGSSSKRRLSASSNSSSHEQHAHHVFDESPKTVETDFLNRARWGSRRIHIANTGPVAEGMYYYPGIYSSPRNLRPEFDWGVSANTVGSDDQNACRPGSGASTAHNTPRLMGNGPRTPKSVCGEYGVMTPNYMTNTESFCAKLRSHSAPRQRPEKSTVGGSRKVLSLKEIMASRNSFSGVRMNAEFKEDVNF